MGEVDHFRQCWRTASFAPILHCKENSGAVVPLEIDFQLLGYMVVAVSKAPASMPAYLVVSRLQVARRKVHKHGPTRHRDYTR